MNGSLQEFEMSRKSVEKRAEWIYYGLAIANGFVMLTLTWRIDSPVMRLWSIIASLAIVFSSIIWLKATSYAAQGAQLNTARIFLGLDWTIAALNVVCLFFDQLAPKEAETVAYGAVYLWSIVGSGCAVITAIIGLGFLLMFSPDRAQHDLARKYQHHLIKLANQMLDSGNLPDDLADRAKADAVEMTRHIVTGTGKQAVGYGRKISGEREATEPPKIEGPSPDAIAAALELFRRTGQNGNNNHPNS